MSGTTVRNLRQNSTEAEKKLWECLRADQLGAHFRRQHPAGPYIVDFMCLKQKLIIEIDGGQHAERIDEDTARTAWLEKDGYRVIRFWNNDVIENIEGVIFQISDVLDAPSCRPPSSREEE